MADMFTRIVALLFCLAAGSASGADRQSEALARADLHPPSAETGRINPRAGLQVSSPDVFELPLHQPRILKLDLTRDPNDIWDRIRRGFAMPDLDSDLVIEQQLFYLQRPNFLKQVFERGARYLYHIVDELERRGLPTELALLPMVESNYNPLAYSRAHASGLWQFIPSTGRNFNLTQDKWVDERRDVVASTSAALDYLEYIYEMHGDWHLALASYNWGEGAVGRAIRRNLEAGQPAEYSHLQMPAETRKYIPKLQALKNIVARPELFDFELPHVSNYRHFVSVEAPRGLDLATAAEMAEMPLDEFVALNPGFKRPIVAYTGLSFAIPVDRIGSFTERLGQVDHGERDWKTYQIQRGDTLSGIAGRFGIPIGALRQANGLTQSSQIRAGDTLVVPDGSLPLETRLPAATTRRALPR
jgi:membrane-bound lytic murein transglycosylase D